MKRPYLFLFEKQMGFEQLSQMVNNTNSNAIRGYLIQQGSDQSRDLDVFLTRSMHRCGCWAKLAEDPLLFVSEQRVANIMEKGEEFPYSLT
jgi:hypothetical protein